MDQTFQLVSDYSPQGDQPKAIEKIVKAIQNGDKHQTLLGATGTGKTFTMSNVIQAVNKPTLIMAHNKTLAGQLYSEFKQFFFLTMLLSILSVIMITISQRLMSHPPTLLLKKMRVLMMKLINCGTQRQVLYLNVAMSLL